MPKLPHVALLIETSRSYGRNILEGVVRRSLERRLRKLLHRSPKEEILRVQIERAKQLLLSTNLPSSAIATKCGFNEAKYFSQVFRTKVGEPPGEFRRNINQHP